MTPGAHKSFRLPESRPHFPPQKDYRTKHVKIELTLDFDKKRISGACTLEIEPIRKGVERVRLDACELDIGGVTVDGKPTPFEYDGSVLEVPISSGGSRHLVKAEYSAVPRTGVFFTGPDKEHPEKEVQAWSHNEAEAARYWYPCHDHPGERSSSELVITVPKGFRVISNGKLLSVKEDGQTSTFHWMEELTHVTYLTSFVAGRFGEITQEANGVPLHYYFPESKRADVLRYFGETPKMIEVFESILGVKYPYVKYDQTTVEDFVAGGEENLNATTLAMNYYPDAGSEADFSTTYSAQYQRPVDLVSHELAHQWFGDLVTCSDWAHVWLNEGFASYFQELYLERTRGVDEMTWHLATRVEEYFDEDRDEYRRPIVARSYVWPDDLFDNHLYPKAAFMLHELRFLMGDDAFFSGISQYLKSFTFSLADTEDFRKSMERTSGLALEEFFEQSFFRPGHPEFDVAYSWDGEAKAATLRVKQAQQTDDGTPVYRLPCEVVFYLGRERRAFRAALDSADQSLTYSLPSKPTIVEFDPRLWLLARTKFVKSLDLLLNQLEGSQDSWSRAEAAKQLGAMRLGAAVEGLARAAAKEQFWYVRACAFRALGEIGTEDALKALTRVEVPKDRRARRGLAEALGHFKEDAARKQVQRMLEEDESPLVKCEAALSLAKSWPDGALPHLKEAMKAHSPNETLAEACLAAMGKLKGQEVNGIVRESLAYGRPTRVRVGALKAIKERGIILDDEVPVLKEILKGDKEFRVRLYLIDSVIRTLGDKRFEEAARESSESDMDLRVRRKALETYHELAASAENSAALSRLRAEVEELKSKQSTGAPG
ncbi:MAG: M1 family metallopeptidase [Thaumarchaeota archaeon]|nr:M1 family metallopeptidase [Nitrososphaerota archaeon]